MKVKLALIYYMLSLGTILLWSCTEKTNESDGKMLRQLWDSKDDEYELATFIYDTVDSGGLDYHVGSVRLSDLSAYVKLKNYVLATTNPSSTVLRVINELHLSTNTLIPKPDSLIEPPDKYWEERTPYLLGEICFIIKQKPDSIRFVYLQNRNDSNSIVDKTFPYTGSYIDNILSSVVDSTNDVRLGYARSDDVNNRLFNLITTIWTKDRSYNIYGWALWYYSDCLDSTTWIANERKEQYIVGNLIQMACEIRAAGGFQAKYGYRTVGEVQQNKNMED